MSTPASTEPDQLARLIAARKEGGLARAVSDSVVLAGRALRRMVRYPGLWFSIIVFPAVFLSGFIVLLQKSFEAQGIPDYVQYVVPIAVIQAQFFTGMGTAVTMASEAESGMLARIRAMPVSRYAIFGGPVLGYLVRGAIVLLVVLAVGTAFGFRFDAGPVRAGGFVLLSMTFGAVSICGYSCLGLALRRTELTQSVILVPYAPLLLLSTGFSPAGNWPGWLQPVVVANPVSHIAEALRGLAAGGDVAGSVTVSVGWLASSLIVAAIAGSWLVRRAT